MTKQEEAHAQCASALTLRVATVVTMTRLVWLGSARTLLVVAVVVVARLARCSVEAVARLARCARSGRCRGRLTIIVIVILAPHPHHKYCS